MNKRGELSRIDRRIAEIKDGQLACYEAIENGRRQIEKLEAKRAKLIQEQQR